MRTALFLALLLASAWCSSAAPISTNFWDKLLEREKALHSLVVELAEYCSKDGVTKLNLTHNGVIAQSDILQAIIRRQEKSTTPLSEIKKVDSVYTFLTLISHGNHQVTAQILAFSDLTKEQKQELINKLDRNDKLVEKLIVDLQVYIEDVALLGF